MSKASVPLLEPQPRSQRGGCLYAPCKWLCESISALFKNVFSSIKGSSTAVWNTLRKEPAKTAHAFKMGLAMSIAFLLVLVKDLYNIFSTHAIWAIMTVVVVFEYSIGATLSKGYNRGAGTFLAGVLAVLIGQLTHLTASVAHPILVFTSVFVICFVVTFAKLLPSMKSYEYGFRIFILTFCLILVAEYRQGDPVSTAVNRFLIILLGATIGIGVNIFVLPLWAGEELHEFIAKNFDSVANSLEVCVEEYLHGTVLERVPSKIFMGLAADDPVYNGYRSALISANKEESLAGFATWEPPHGRFKMLRYPWMSYVKVGAVLRHCTYSVVALHGCLRSAIQAPIEVRKLFENELRQVGIEGAMVLRKLGRQVQTMQRGDQYTILDGVRRAVERLQQSLYLHSYLLVKQQDGILDESHTDDISLSVYPELRSTENSDRFFRTGSSNKLGIAYGHDEFNEDAGRCVKKIHSWPSRPMDDFNFGSASLFEQRVRVLESADALSLGTFATLLMEVALRLDYVVEAVEELAEQANFAEYRMEHVYGGLKADQSVS